MKTITLIWNGPRRVEQKKKGEGGCPALVFFLVAEMDLAKGNNTRIKGRQEKKDPEKCKPKVHGQSRGYKRLLRQLKLRTVRYWRVASGPASRAVDIMQLYEGIILAAASGLWATA